MKRQKLEQQVLVNSEHGLPNYKRTLYMLWQIICEASLFKTTISSSLVAFWAQLPDGVATQAWFKRGIRWWWSSGWGVTSPTMPFPKLGSWQIFTRPRNCSSEYAKINKLVFQSNGSTWWKQFRCWKFWWRIWSWWFRFLSRLRWFRCWWFWPGELPFI